MLNNAFISKNDDGSANVALFLDGEAYLAHSSHANYKAIIDAISADDLSADYDALFDTGKMVQAKFETALAQVADVDLSERISVRGGVVTLDGDPAEGALEEQILHFVREGADFAPLVRFYEKLVTNPLGNVKEGVYSFAVANGLTITEDGNLLGYKSVYSETANGETKYRPTRASASGGDRVNGVEVGAGNHIYQAPGDVVEMPRSKVLNEPSAMCGVGLHIGTFTYAEGFSGDTVLLVEFNPRDIVSLPDSYSAWKLRVCRYKVIESVTEPLDVPVYMADAVEEPTEEAGGIFQDGQRVVDAGGDEGTIRDEGDDGFYVVYDSARYGSVPVDEDDLNGFITLLDEEPAPASRPTSSTTACSPTGRVHGKGGPRSKQAEGNGLNPAQDPKTGLFVAGRPGSGRDRSTGRFA